MAEAKIETRTVKKMVETEVEVQSVVLELSVEEASALLFLTGKCRY